MESSRNMRVEKRGYEQSVEDEADNLPESKKPKMPALARLVFFSFFLLLFFDGVPYFSHIINSGSWSKQFFILVLSLAWKMD